MSGHTSAEAAPIVRAALLGAACGLSLVFGSYALAAHILDHLRRR